MQLPLLADVTKEISASYGTLLKDAGIALRGLFIIDPAGNLQQANINNLGVGRDVDEALRLVKAYQFVAEHGEVCPAGWTPGAATMIPTTDGAVSYFEKQADSAPDDDFNAQLPALKSEAEVTAAIAGPGPVVLDFYASWCGKCRQIAPHVEALMAEHKNVRVFKVDTDALPDVAAKYNASVLPTFSFFKARAPLHAGPFQANALFCCAPGRQARAATAAGVQEGPSGRGVCQPREVTRLLSNAARASSPGDDVTTAHSSSLPHPCQRDTPTPEAAGSARAAMSQNINSPLKGGLKRADMDARLNAIHAPLPVRRASSVARQAQRVRRLAETQRAAAHAGALTAPGCAAHPRAAGGGQGCARGADQREGCEGRGRAAAREVRALRRSRQRARCAQP